MRHKNLIAAICYLAAALCFARILCGAEPMAVIKELPKNWRAQTIYRTSIVTLGACAIADQWMTHSAIQRGAMEINPAMRANGTALKAGVVGGLFLAEWLTRKHSRKPWTVTNYVAASVWCGAAGWNAGQ